MHGKLKLARGGRENVVPVRRPGQPMSIRATAHKSSQVDILELSVRRRHLEPAPGGHTSRFGRENLVQCFAEGGELCLSELYGYLLRVGGVEFDVCVGDCDGRS